MACAVIPGVNDMPDQLSERVAALEKSVALLQAAAHELRVGHDVQAEILTQIQAELIESDRLLDSVGRLGAGAGALADALIKVDMQQQMLSRLGRQLDEVQANSTTAEEVEAKVKHAKRLATDETAEATARARAERRRLARRLIAVIGISVTALGSLLAYTINANYHTCMQRQLAVDIQARFYADVRGLARPGTPFADSIDMTIQQLRGTLMDCDAQYPVHWGADPAAVSSS